MVRSGCVAIGWPESGDLGQLRADRVAFAERVKEIYGNNAPKQQITAITGIMFRFVHEIQIGDVVVSTVPSEAAVRIGQIEGHYFYDTTTSPDYPGLRRVRWLATVPRASLSDAGRRSLKGRMSCYAARVGADEFRRIAGDAIRGE